MVRIRVFRRRPRSLLQRRYARLRWVSFGLLVALIGLQVADPQVVASLRLRAFDALQQVSPAARDPDIPVRIVDIDEKSLRAFGQWPWPRTRIAELVDGLRAQGAAAVGFNILFPESDRLSWDRLAATLDLPEDVEDGLRARRSNDEVLADAFAAIPTVLGVGLRNAADRYPNGGFRFPPVARLGSGTNLSLRVFNDIVPAIDPLHSGALSAGALNLGFGRDGVVRRVPLVVEAEGQLLPTLTLEMLRLVVGAPVTIVETDATGVTGVRLRTLNLPTDARARLWIRFTPHDPDRFVSAADVLQAAPAARSVRGKIVLVGATAGGLVDIRATPLTPAMSAVEVHAQLLEAMLSDAALERSAAFRLAEAVATFGLGLLVVFGLSRLPVVWSMASVVAVAAVPAAVMWLGYDRGGVLVDGAYPTLALLALFTLQTGAGLFVEERSKRHIRGVFGQYLSPVLVDQLSQSGEPPKTGGTKRQITVLFCDVRAFTTISEAYADDPEGLTALMNRYLTVVTSEVMELGGTIDKYIGDAVMAFWNAPLDDPDHAYRSCLAALRVQAAMDKLNSDREAEGGWRDDSDAARRGPVHLRVGLGINTGTCLVGNLGSAQRFSYSALGDPVNVAARLEATTKDYKTGIVIGEATAAAVAGRLAVLRLDRVAVRGREAEMHIYTLIGDGDTAASADWRDLRANHDAMLTAIADGEPERARARLDLCEANPLAPSALYAVYRERIDRMPAGSETASVRG